VRSSCARGDVLLKGHINVRGRDGKTWSIPASIVRDVEACDEGSKLTLLTGGTEIVHEAPSSVLDKLKEVSP
jgi:hypothetical protein